MIQKGYDLAKVKDGKVDHERLFYFRPEDYKWSQKAFYTKAVKCSAYANVMCMILKYEDFQLAVSSKDI